MNRTCSIHLLLIISLSSWCYRSPVVLWVKRRPIELAVRVWIIKEADFFLTVNWVPLHNSFIIILLLSRYDWNTVRKVELLWAENSPSFYYNKYGTRFYLKWGSYLEMNSINMYSRYVFINLVIFIGHLNKSIWYYT